MANVAVLFGGISPEHDISILTGLQAERGLLNSIHKVSSIYWSKGGDFFLLPNGCEASSFASGLPAKAEKLTIHLGDSPGFYQGGKSFSKPKKLEIDVVLNALHGGPGEDGSLQALLNLAGIKYSGPGALGASLGMDKLAFAGLCANLGIAHLDRHLLSYTTQPQTITFGSPFILKPRYGGSSIGIDVVSDLETAKARLRTNVHLKLGAVIEPFRSDLFDLQIAVKTFPKLVLSAIERPLRDKSGGEFLTYKDKYVGGTGMVEAPRELPAKLSDVIRESIYDYTNRLVDAVPLRGITRIDFLSNGVDELYVNEINTIPGSLSKYLFIEPMIPFENLLLDLIGEATEVSTFAPTTAGADGSALSSAGTIASKLG